MGERMTVTFERVTRVRAPRDLVFAMSLRTDLHAESMSRYRERALTSNGPEPMALGDSVTWRAWHFGVPWTMTSQIVECEPPERFVDQQARGPFALFRHEHTFTEDGGFTIMTDRVRLRAPGGPLGRVLEPLLGRYIERLIDERNDHLARRAESDL